MASSSHFGGIVRSASRVLTLDLGEPKEAAAEGVLEAVEDTGEEVELTEEITNPDVPRNLTATAGGTEADIKAIKVTVTGTNAAGEELTEEIGPFVENVAATKEGSKAFAMVTKIAIPAHDGEAATTAVGFGEKIGLGVKLPRDTVIFAYVENAKESTAPTVKTSSTVLASNTIDTNTGMEEKALLVDLHVPGA